MASSSRRGSLAWTASACAFAAGCNALLGNADHDIATADASSATSLDAGTLGATGASEPDSGALDRDAQEADVQGVAWDSAPGTIADGDSGANAGESGVAPLGFIQAASKDTKDSVMTVSVAYSNPQQAGDLNIVVVGWSDSSHNVSSISDSAGNMYALAAAPVTASGVALAIYYAANIAGAGANTATVQLDAADFLCVAVLEYAGLSGVDRTAAGSGAGKTASSGTVITSSPREIVFGAGEPDQSGTANFSSAGSGFSERILTGISGMLAEDMTTTQPGTYAATGGLDSSSAWVMQVVAFK
jgi:hypothetical protein